MRADVELKGKNWVSAFLYFCLTGGKVPLALKGSVLKTHFEYARNVVYYFRKEGLRCGERGAEYRKLNFSLYILIRIFILRSSELISKFVRAF